MAGKGKGQRGGARAGSGRKEIKKVLDESVRSDIKKAERKLKKKYEKGIIEAGLELIYDPNVSGATKASILRAYLDAFSEKTKDDGKKEAQKGPSIGLPPVKEEDGV